MSLEPMRAYVIRPVNLATEVEHEMGIMLTEALKGTITRNPTRGRLIYDLRPKELTNG
jgi:hypothetical protein